MSPINFLISYGLCATSKLSKYVTILFLRQQAIRYVRFTTDFDLTISECENFTFKLLC